MGRKCQKPDSPCFLENCKICKFTNQNVLKLILKVLNFVVPNFGIGKKKHFAVFNFAIWWLENISWVFSFAI